MGTKRETTWRVGVERTIDRYIRERLEIGGLDACLSKELENSIMVTPDHRSYYPVRVSIKFVIDQPAYQANDRCRNSLAVKHIVQNKYNLNG